MYVDCVFMVFWWLLIGSIVAGSFYSPIYYTFSCYPLLIIFYNGGISTLGILAICLTFHPSFDKPGYENYRAGVFVGMALFSSTVFPPALFMFGFTALWGVS